MVPLSTDSGHERIKLVVTKLFYDFFPRRLAVNFRVCRIVELLRHKVSVFLRKFFRLLMAPFIPSAPGVSTSSAPYARSRLRRSILIVSGITRMALRPLAAATIARPIPVFPLVGSMIVSLSF